LSLFPNNVTVGNNADGWLAMETALNYPLRPNALRKFIFISTRHRQVSDPTITHDSLISHLAQEQIYLNVVVDASYVQTTEPPNNNTLGIIYYDDIRISVTTDGLQKGRNYTAGGRILGPGSAFTTVDDYVFLVQDLVAYYYLSTNLPLLGSSWDHKFVTSSEQGHEYLIQALLNVVNLEANPLTLLTLPISEPDQGLQMVGQCPFSQYNPIAVNNSLFFMIAGNYNFNQAITTCIEQHAQLAIIKTIQEATALQSLPSAVWVGSFIGQENQMPGTNFIAVRGGQVIVVQSTDTLSALCFVNPAPEACASATSKY